MKRQDKAAAAVLAVFPTRETFVKFAENSENKRIIQSFVDYAVRNKIIETATPKGLEEFIAAHVRPAEDRTPPDHLTFEELLEKKEEMLQFQPSVRALADRINTLIASSGIDLPKVSNSMLTRLKTKPADNAHKQNVIRSFAFWLGHERTELGRKLNYETLMKICPEDKPAESYKEGIRIGFTLMSRGDVIDHPITNWLRTCIKHYLDKTMEEFLQGTWGKVRSHDFTTFYVDIPKKEESGDPAAYRSCLKHAVSLCHHVAIRWAISKYYTNNRFLSIGIVAGKFASLDNYLLPMLNAKLSGDPIIRVSDYVRQCLLINDTRVILCRTPSETILFKGETFSIWWIVSFWSPFYFDFIPDLLDASRLVNNALPEEILSRLRWFPEESRFLSSDSGKTNAITAFLNFPHNSLLGVEIAKTLYYRRQIQEALEILRIALSIDPTDLTARTLRMVLFRELALSSPAYHIADTFFAQAEHEALYVLENCEAKHEDFYCEYAGIYIARAMLIVRFLRNGNKSREEMPDIARAKRIVFDSLDQAEYLLRKAMAVSLSAIRSYYALNATRVMKAILKNDEDIFVNPKKALSGKYEVVANSSAGFRLQIKQINLGTEEYRQQLQHDFIEDILAKRFRINDDSISLQAFRASSHFCHAVALWDFSPRRTIAIAKRVLWVLNVAMDMAREEAKQGVCIYSATRGYSEMMPAKDFIRHVKKGIQMVTQAAGKDLAERNDSDVIEPEGQIMSLLMTLNF
ncbi:MAG: hypothetical protein EG826_10500 [Deltaproteobacteria bacterium]|nr:hypothetical protein [Deltaproteobacteria bacterium]